MCQHSFRANGRTRGSLLAFVTFDYPTPRRPSAGGTVRGFQPATSLLCQVRCACLPLLFNVIHKNSQGDGPHRPGTGHSIADDNRNVKIPTEVDR
jgi:hypothetical protein